MTSIENSIDILRRGARGEGRGLGCHRGRSVGFLLTDQAILWYVSHRSELQKKGAYASEKEGFLCLF